MLSFYRATCIFIVMFASISGCNKVTPNTSNDDASGESDPPPKLTSADDTGLVDSASGGDSRNDVPSGSPTSPQTPQEDPGTITAPNGNRPTESIAFPSAVEPPSSSSLLTPDPDILNRAFATLEPNPTTVPSEIVDHLVEIDTAIEELVRLGINNFVDELMYVDGGLRLGRMKHAAGGRLAASEEATDKERRAGLVAQLVALSHMSGLRDVQAAKELERFARQLSQADDPDLAHQSRVVLLGFEVQALQNGVKSNPNDLLTQIEGLFTLPEQRKFPEFMALQNAAQVLEQMGFSDAAGRVKSIIATEFIDSPDPQLRGEAWGLATLGSQAVENLMNSMKPLGTAELDPQAVRATAQMLVEEFPNATTLEQLAEMLTSVEYSGEIATSQNIASVIRKAQDDIQAQAYQTESLRSKLSAHEARTALLGKPLQLDGLVTFDGTPFTIESIQNKVVLVDFWASWCIQCRQELRFVESAFDKFDSGNFEIVGVNMDHELSEAENLLKQESFRWTNVRSGDPEALGFQSNFAKQLGVNTIPFMVLIGRDGNVAALHVRGERLAPKIQELLDSSTN